MDGIKRGTGLCHVYWGDGKGKTTAAMGLAPVSYTHLRAHET